MGTIAMIQLNTDSLINIVAFSSALFVIFLCFTYFKKREDKAQEKRDRIEELRNEIREKAIPIKCNKKGGSTSSVQGRNTENMSAKEAALAGSGFTLVSLFDIYSSVDRHAEIFDVLAQRDPNVFSELNATEVLMKVIGAENTTISAWISHYKGQEAENIALNYLREQGLQAHAFDSLTHETTDLYVIGDGGETIEYSVKCGDVEYIKHCLDTSNASHFVINTEAYNALVEQGLVDEYAVRGKEIITAGFSDEYLTSLGENAFIDIGDAADLGDSIPWLAASLLVWKTGKNLVKVCKGEESLREFGLNTAMDTIGLGTRGISALAGWELGSAVGTLVMPGAGTVVGGIVGMFGGAFTSGKIIDSYKEKTKWNDIIKAQEYFGDRFGSDCVKSGFDNFVDEMYDTKHHEKLYAEELTVYTQFASQLDPYCDDKVTVQAVLSEQYYLYLKEIIENIKYVKRHLHDELEAGIYNMLPEESKKKLNRHAKRLAGELV